MSDTPRTDDLARGNHVVPTEFAEGLERELAPLWQSLRDSQDEVLRLTFENRDAELEREQLKEIIPAALQAECRAQRFCQERDNLRVAINRALPFFKWILETMNPPFDFDKFADASVAYEQLKKAALPSKPKPANRHLG